MKKKLNLKNLKLSSFRTSDANHLKAVKGGTVDTCFGGCHCFRHHTCGCETEQGSCSC